MDLFTGDTEPCPVCYPDSQAPRGSRMPATLRAELPRWALDEPIDLWPVS